jgi:hypothetical protein
VNERKEREKKDKTDHETEGRKGEGGDLATEPQNLTVGDEDDSEVLEDGVNRDGEVLLKDRITPVSNEGTY